MERKNFLRVGFIAISFALLLGSVLSCEEPGQKDYTLDDQNKNSGQNLNSNVTSTVTLPSYRITSPYDGINWDAYGQYKAALHTHTTRSDGANTLAQMIEEKYRQDYDIVAITDHNALNASWTTGLGRLTEERYAQIKAVEGEDGKWRGMLMISGANEQSRGEHINSFFADFNNGSGSTIESNIRTTEGMNGVSFINHIGRYTHASNPDRDIRIAASNKRETIDKYIGLFMQFPTCVGMEIINRRDLETYSDRILWDNILKDTIPYGRNVWGFSNDDSHSHASGENGNSYNMFVMPANTVENFRVAMTAGHFYPVALVSKLELGETFYGRKDLPPTITSITVNSGSITITTENVTRIDWISDPIEIKEDSQGGVVIGTTTATTSTFDITKVGSYIRANLMGPGGIAFTQPFIVTK
jgi:hypothetical protein